MDRMLLSSAGGGIAVLLGAGGVDIVTHRVLMTAAPCVLVGPSFLALRFNPASSSSGVLARRRSSSVVVGRGR